MIRDVLKDNSTNLGFFIMAAKFLAHFSHHNLINYKESMVQI